MNPIPTPDEAYAVLQQYNHEPFHLEHGQIVSKVMGVFAREYDSERGVLEDRGDAPRHRL